AWPLTFHGKTVTVTHPAGLDTDPHLALRRLRHLALNQFKRTASLRHLYRPHLSHRPPLYRVRLHFTPTYSSWLNQVELWFARIERDVIARGVLTSVPDRHEKPRGLHPQIHQGSQNVFAATQSHFPSRRCQSSVYRP